MDIVFSEHESKRFIMADTSGGIIYIMKNSHWKDPIRSKPTYKNSGYTCIPIDEFMLEALSWETFLRALYEIDDNPKKLIHFLLDVRVCSLERYHDMFTDLSKT